MDIVIRKEVPSDYPIVFNLIKKAFISLDISSKDEQFLVERLRKSDSFIPELSIVAEYNDRIVGHILLTKLKIIHAEKEFDSLSLAPISVLPEYQNKGIGGKLIEVAHERAKVLGYKSIVLVGHENYYPRFGYELTSKYNIKLPFNAPEQNCMVIELEKNALDKVQGMVEYPKEFFEQD